MRKIFNTLVASILLVACLFMVGCAKIPKDYKDARENLISADYDVYVSESLVETISIFVDFASDALLYYEDDFYISEYDAIVSELIKDYSKYYEKGIFATKCESSYDLGYYYEEDLVLLYFNDRESAEGFYNEVEPYLDDFAMCEFEAGVPEDWSYGREGKIVYIGSEGALEDVKG